MSKSCRFTILKMVAICLIVPSFVTAEPVCKPSSEKLSCSNIMYTASSNSRATLGHTGIGALWGLGIGVGALGLSSLDSAKLNMNDAIVLLGLSSTIGAVAGLGYHFFFAESYEDLLKLYNDATLGQGTALTSFVKDVENAVNLAFQVDTKASSETAFKDQLRVSVSNLTVAPLIKEFSLSEAGTAICLQDIDDLKLITKKMLIFVTQRLIEGPGQFCEINALAHLID